MVKDGVSYLDDKEYYVWDFLNGYMGQARKALR
jgi:hypothetical protein